MHGIFKTIISLFADNMTLDGATVSKKVTESMSGVFCPDMHVIYDIFAQIGIYLLLIYFCMDILDKLSSENFSIDVLILNFIKIIAGYALILNGFEIMQGLNGLATMAGNDIMNEVAKGEGLNKGNGVDDLLDFIIVIVMSLLNLGPNLIDILLANIILQITLSLVCYQRAIRIALRMLVAPFILADVIGHGMNNNAMHYLRKLFALYMQAPIMIAIITLATSIDLSFGTPKFKYLAGVIVGAKLLFDSKTISEDLIL